jgi:hypothetical protein
MIESSVLGEDVKFEIPERAQAAVYATRFTCSRLLIPRH